jgi:hypothetical protein
VADEKTDGDESPEPWFTVHLNGSVEVSLTWLFAFGAAGAVLCLGEPDLLDALVRWIWSLA